MLLGMHRNRSLRSTGSGCDGAHGEDRGAEGGARLEEGVLLKRFSTLVVAVCLGLVVPLALAGSASTAAVRSSATTLHKTAQHRRGHGQAPGTGKGRRWKAFKGPYFNDPHLKAGHFRIESKVIDTIRHTPKGATIRIAVYSFDRLPVAKALIAAHRRGVHVQMLLNDHQDTKAMKAIRAVIGTNRWHKSFIYKCQESCRGTANEYNNLHSKFYSFTQAGKSKDVMAIGSANMMLNADLHQWNDLYFIVRGPRAVPAVRGAVQGHEARTTTSASRPRFFCGTPATGAPCDDSVDKYTAWGLPKLVWPQERPGAGLLAKIQCLTPDGTADRPSARTWPWRCTRCAASAATTSPRRSGRSTPRAATSA